MRASEQSKVSSGGVTINFVSEPHNIYLSGDSYSVSGGSTSVFNGNSDRGGSLYIITSLFATGVGVCVCGRIYNRLWCRAVKYDGVQREPERGERVKRGPVRRLLVQGRIGVRQRAVHLLRA